MNNSTENTTSEHQTPCELDECAECGHFTIDAKAAIESINKELQQKHEKSCHLSEKVNRLQKQIDTLNCIVEQKDDRMRYLEEQIRYRDEMIANCTKWYGNPFISYNDFI